jgi:Fur family ferric uptake transcriptional regulator
MNTFVKDTLKHHQLRNTTCREEVIQLFSTKGTALSHSDLESSLGEMFDRVTLYRTLKTFVEKGILHKVLDDNGLRYALCKQECATHGHHHHDHVHFKCLQCGETNCLESTHIPSFSLPEGYKALETNLLIQGVCPQCSK